MRSRARWRVLESGGTIHQETRLFNPDTARRRACAARNRRTITATFPEPDLVPLRISEKWLAEIRATMPELPAREARALHRRVTGCANTMPMC